MRPLKQIYEVKFPWNFRLKQYISFIGFQLKYSLTPQTCMKYIDFHLWEYSIKLLFNWSDYVIKPTARCPWYLILPRSCQNWYRYHGLICSFFWAAHCIVSENYFDLLFPTTSFMTHLQMTKLHMTSARNDFYSWWSWKSFQWFFIDIS